jgi:hypothetical protein
MSYQDAEISRQKCAEAGRYGSRGALAPRHTERTLGLRVGWLD